MILELLLTKYCLNSESLSMPTYFKGYVFCIKHLVDNLLAVNILYVH